MKKLPLFLILGALALAVVAFAATSTRTQAPFTIAEITRTSTGLDNSLPPDLFLRARGLGVVAGELRDKGFRITSLYRSPAVDDAVIQRNIDQGIPNLGQIGRPGPHTECRALDIGLDSKRSTPAALAAALAKTFPGQLGTLGPESDHVHITFAGADLDELGAIFVGANPAFDPEGTLAVLGAPLDAVDLGLGQSIAP